jgi:hypothetical protein
MVGKHRRRRKRSEKQEWSNSSLFPSGAHMNGQPERVNDQLDISERNTNSGFVRLFHVIGLHRILPGGRVARKPDIVFLVPVDEEETGRRQSIQAARNEQSGTHEITDSPLLFIGFVLFCLFVVLALTVLCS